MSKPERMVVDETADWASTFDVLGQAVACSERAQPAFFEEQRQLEAHDLAVRAQWAAQREQRAMAEGLAALDRRRAEVGLAERLTVRQEPEQEPHERPPLAEDHYRTSVELTAALFRRGKPRAALACDLWKAETRKAGGSGEYLPCEALTALLMAAGLSRRTAQRAKAEGVGVLWDVERDQRDRRRVIYHLRRFEDIQRALDLTDHSEFYQRTGIGRDLGKWVTLPAVAYTGVGEYINHASAAWLQAHSESDRRTQSLALKCTVRCIQQRQRAAGLKQTARIDEYPKPRNDAERLELAERLAGPDGHMMHHWRGPRGTYRRQTSNQYDETGPARVLGRKRSRRIAAKINSASLTRGAAGGVDFDELPRRFESSERVSKWQAQHPSQGALVYGGRLLPAGALCHEYRYSANAAYSL